MSDLETILAYHQRTKHSLQRYAAGPGELDWASQPNPFRYFVGSPLLPLPLLADRSHPRYVELYIPEQIVPQAMTLDNIAALFELSFGLSAWKQYGDNRWALRCNPSSGNLHPTEAYAVVAGCPGIDDGVHHYVSRDHVLEQRCRFNTAANGSKGLLPPGAFLVGLSSIHWREAWKYGERAYRYCQHDVGHAIAAIRYAAATLGWQAHVLDSWGDAEIGTLLGVDRDEDFGEAEREQPDVILLVTSMQTGFANREFDADVLIRAAQIGYWQGHANALSTHHLHDWSVIDGAARACIKPETPMGVWQAPARPEPPGSACKRSAVELIKQRRSAQAFDGLSSMPASTFYRMLDLTLPRKAVPPWDAIAWAPRVHLALLVHRVDGLAPGLYLLLRNDTIEARLRAALSPAFTWQRITGCPVHLLLFRLIPADVRMTARTLSCHQDIASDGAFGVSMLAEFETSLNHEPWAYRQLFWEAGMLGQTLYLEAEAAGMRGTGIGCYFDDAVHDMLGISGHKIQSLYHFTVGAALTDDRLQTLPAYAHLQRGISG